MNQCSPRKRRTLVLLAFPATSGLFLRVPTDSSLSEPPHPTARRKVTFAGVHSFNPWN